MNFFDFLFDAFSVLGLFGNGDENNVDIDPINKKLTLVSLGLLLISILLIYFYKTEFFEIEQLFKTVLWSFLGSIIISFASLITLNHFKIIHSLVKSSFIFCLISSSIFLTTIVLLIKTIDFL